MFHARFPGLKVRNVTRTFKKVHFPRPGHIKMGEFLDPWAYLARLGYSRIGYTRSQELSLQPVLRKGGLDEALAKRAITKGAARADFVSALKAIDERGDTFVEM